jgi:PD-(D/E)XK nuclease superfamily
VSDVSISSYSALTAHRKCPQSWGYSYVRRLERDDTDIPVHRDFGSWWHALRAADALERGRALESLRAIPRVIRATDDAEPMEAAGLTVEQVFDYARIWWHARQPEVQDAWLEALGQSLPDRLTDLHERWRERWGDDRDAEVPLAVELRWRRDLPVISTPDGPRDPRTQLVGAVDEVYLDRKRGLVVIRDAKTSKDLDAATTADDMMDSQLQLYAWGATPMVRSWGAGRVGAVGYDRARSVAPRPPTLTQSGRLAVREGQPSIGMCDLHTYQEWSRGSDGTGVPYPGRAKNGSQAGLYTAETSVIEKLSTPAAQSAWFQRTLTPVNVNLVKAHLRSAVDTAFDLHASRSRVESTGSAARNLTKMCRYCDFVKLCRVEMVGGPVDLEDIDLADYRLRKRS